MDCRLALYRLQGGQFQQGQFQEWEVQALDPHRSLEFANHLLPVFSERLGTTLSSSAQTFLETLLHDPSIAAWSENPLLLSLVALVYVQEGVLPGCRASLYHDVTMLMPATRLTNAQEREQLRSPTVVDNSAFLPPPFQEHDQAFRGQHLQT